MGRSYSKGGVPRDCRRHPPSSTPLPATSGERAIRSEAMIGRRAVPRSAACRLSPPHTLAKNKLRGPSNGEKLLERWSPARLSKTSPVEYPSPRDERGEGDPERSDDRATGRATKRGVSALATAHSRQK